MNRTSGHRYFDFSTILILGIATLFLVSLPGGCGDSENGDEDTDLEAAAEPTAPPMMEIVDPEPGDIEPAAPEGDQGDDPAEEPEAPEGEEAQEEEEPVEQEESSGSTYTVQSGDTLYGIAVQFGVSIEELLEANGMEDANALQVGQVLEIPQ